LLIKHALYFLFFLAGATASMLGTPSAGLPQHCVGECDRPLSQELKAVLDAVFPLTFAGDPYLILRFAPTERSEFQIAIGMKTDGTYEVRKYSPPEGAEHIGAQMLRLRAVHPDDTPTELAKYIKIEQKQIQLDAKVLSRLMKTLKELRIPAEVGQNILVDASSYEFWFVDRPTCHVLHLAVSDADYGHDAKAHPLVQWMNRVRAAVEAADGRVAHPK